MQDEPLRLGPRRPLVGVGYRREAIAQAFEFLDDIEVFEVTADHYIYGGPRVREAIVELSRLRPIVAHGVGLSIGTALPPDRAYLDAVAAFLDAVGAPWYSEHLAFTKTPRADVAQLLPLPRTRAVAEVLVHNIELVKRSIPVPLVFENISYYFDYPEPDYTELEFLELVLDSAGADLLLDLENLRLNSLNHRFDPHDYLDRLPGRLVRAVHLAGGTEFGPLVLDTHDRPVPPDDFELLGHLLQFATPDTIIVERDDAFDRFEEVGRDVRRTANVVARNRGGSRAAAGAPAEHAGRAGPLAHRSSIP